MTLGSRPPGGLGGPSTPGKSAYQSWLDAGNTGTEAQFLAAIKGKSAYELWLAAGNSGTQLQFLASLAGKSAYQTWLDAGNTGTQAQFLASLNGTNGKSAYQSWLDAGNTGTEAQWVASMQGGLWRSGAGAPSNALGKDGDLYANTLTYDVYMRAGGTYSVIMNIKGQSGLVDRGAWAASTAYAAGDLVSYQNALYTALTAHTSGATFDATKWMVRFTTPDPNIVTTLDHSAIPADRFVMTAPGSTTLEEAQPWPLDLADATLYYKDPSGILRRPNVTVIPNAPGGGAAASRIILIDKPLPNSPNYSVVTPAVAAAMQPTVTNAVKELGTIGAGQFSFTDRPPLAVVDTSLTPVKDDLTTYTQGSTTSIQGIFTSQGAALTQTLLVGNNETAFTSTLFLRINGGGTSGLHVVTREDTATMVDGAEEVLIKPDTTGGFSAINIFARFTNPGGTGTESALVLRLTTGGLSLWTLTAGGVWTQLKNPAGTNATYSTPIAQGTGYRVTWQWAGTKVRAKIRTVNGADTGWQVRGWQSTVLGAGKIGWGNDIGYTKVGQHSIVRSADLPPAA